MALKIIKKQELPSKGDTVQSMLNAMAKNFAQAGAPPVSIPMKQDVKVGVEWPKIEVPEVSHPLEVKTVPVTSAETTVDTWVNELIALHVKFEAMDGKKVAERMSELKRLLQSIANQEVSSEEEAHFTTSNGTVIFSRQMDKTVVTEPTKLLKHITNKFGDEVVEQVISFGITELKKVLSAAELKPFTEQEPGSRVVKAITPVKEIAEAS